MLKDIEFWKIFAPIITATIAWLVNEYNKRQYEEYKRKEEKYQELISSLRGFYENGENDLKDNFIKQLNLSWLYCSDNVIKKCYVFLESVHEKSNFSADEKEKIMGDLVVSIRKDLISKQLVERTDLTAVDFKHYKTK